MSLLSPLPTLHTYTVSELSFSLKKTVEGAYGNVRLRGEISGTKRHTSGHIYFALKDADAVMDGVCWRGVAGRLAVQPQDGMEVICTGRITTYPGRSKYQIVLESLEHAGEGALLKLLEDRKRALAAEGLFAPENKQLLPFLPETIGVITSPTGAVIRDILHRLRDRFPRNVLLWPVAVQGEGAAAQIVAAIQGFNRLPEAGGVLPRPDVLIVARGGGSIEDLWAFNEEAVVRAAAASHIPIVSAVGHETDTTLVDYAVDRRAPTPTAAAEMAVPVRAELLATLQELQRRLGTSLERGFQEREQFFDDRAERLPQSIRGLLRQQEEALKHLSLRLRHPRESLDRAEMTLTPLMNQMRAALERRLQDSTHQVKTRGLLLESCSYQGVLKRGFAVVRDDQGRSIDRTSRVTEGAHVDLTFQDGTVGAVIAGKT